MPWDYSHQTKLLQNPNSGITWEDNSRPKQHKVKSSQSTKFLRRDPITLKPSELSLDINQEPEFTTCIKNSEMSLSTELSANFIWKWLVITEPQETLSQSSELLSSTRKTTSEDLILNSSEKITSSSPSLELSQDPAIEDINRFSRVLSQEHSDNDRYKIFK